METVKPLTAFMLGTRVGVRISADRPYYLSNQDVATQRFPTRQIDCIYISLK